MQRERAELYDLQTAAGEMNRGRRAVACITCIRKRVRRAEGRERYDLNTAAVEIDRGQLVRWAEGAELWPVRAAHISW